MVGGGRSSKEGERRKGEETKGKLSRGFVFYFKGARRRGRRGKKKGEKLLKKMFGLMG